MGGEISVKVGMSEKEDTRRKEEMGSETAVDPNPRLFGVLIKFISPLTFSEYNNNNFRPIS